MFRIKNIENFILRVFVWTLTIIGTLLVIGLIIVTHGMFFVFLITIFIPPYIFTLIIQKRSI